MTRVGFVATTIAEAIGFVLPAIAYATIVIGPETTADRLAVFFMFFMWSCLTHYAVIYLFVDREFASPLALYGMATAVEVVLLLNIVFLLHHTSPYANFVFFLFGIGMFVWGFMKMIVEIMNWDVEWMEHVSSR